MTIEHLRGGVALVGTAAELATANPVLLARQLSLETDTGVQKIGDGTTHYASLSAVPGGGGGAGGGGAGLGDNLALYSDGLTASAGAATLCVLANEEFAVVGTTFTHDADGAVTVNAACVVAVDAMVDFADASDSTYRTAAIIFNSSSLITEGGLLTVPAVNGFHTQISVHNTVPVPAGTVITLRAQHGSEGDVGMTAEIEVTCLGRTA